MVTISLWKFVTVLGRPMRTFARSIASSTCGTGLSCAMRLTERNETPLKRGTSALGWPAFNKIETSYRFSMPNILLSSAPG
jgi:hypothetical protein